MTNVSLAVGDRVKLAERDMHGAPSYWWSLAQVTGSTWATVRDVPNSRRVLLRVDSDTCNRFALVSDVSAVMHYGGVAVAN